MAENKAFNRAFYESDFDIKKYIRKRIKEIEESDEKDFSKTLLFESLYKMSEVFEDRFNELERKVYEELENPIEEYEIVTAVIKKDDYEDYMGALLPICEKDLESEYIEESVNLVGTLYLKATDKICKQFEKDKLKVIYSLNGTLTSGYISVKRVKRYREEVIKLHNAFSENAIEWNTVNTVLLDRFFELDFSSLPKDAKDLDIDFKEYTNYLMKDVMPLWNVEKVTLKSREFITPSNDKVYYEHEIDVKKEEESALMLICPESGIVGIRQEVGKVIVKTDEESYTDFLGYKINNIYYENEKGLEDIISNKRKYGFLGRYANRSRVVLHTKAELYRKIRELEIEKYIEFIDCEAVGFIDTDEESYIYADMNFFLGADLLPLDKRPVILMKFIRTSNSSLCEAMVRYTLSQIQMDFDEYRCIGILED